ncbi:MAG: RnfABCDGE type electron transport complex subunit D [Clostridia bacterium]|nr:RnfABCDGE type electron transport complex subunit D [Clostridia bacterium]
MSKLTLSVSPHIRSRLTTGGIMLDVVIALIPALIAGTVIFGLRALVLTAVCVASCMLAEFLFEFILKKPLTINDLSAVVTGMLLAFNLPVTIPFWQAVLGSVIAIIVVKQLFGGLGLNFANPAITARIVLFISFANTSMTHWIDPTRTFMSFNWANADMAASATPLAVLKPGSTGSLPSLMNMLLGIEGGCIGETCALALILGGIYLVARKVISFHIPVVFVATVFVLSLLVAPEGYSSLEYATYQILSGGLMIGAIFMATDYVTSPTTSLGKIIFALGCGVITFAIRIWGSYPEGVSFSILFMNLLVPFINKLTPTKPLGGAKAE